MALSDHEQQLLEQMERALASEDPKFASALRGSMTNRAATKSIGVAVLGVVVGLGILLVAITMAIPALGILGFVSIVAGFYFAQKGTKASHNAEKQAQVQSSQLLADSCKGLKSAGIAVKTTGK
jgi:hypothetical protein